MIRFQFYGGVNNLSGKIGDVGNRTGIRTPYNVLGRVFYAGARMSSTSFLNKVHPLPEFGRVGRYGCI